MQKELETSAQNLLAPRKIPPHKDRVFSEGKSANLANLTIEKNEFRRIKGNYRRETK